MCFDDAHCFFPGQMWILEKCNAPKITRVFIIFKHLSTCNNVFNMLFYVKRPAICPYLSKASLTYKTGSFSLISYIFIGHFRPSDRRCVLLMLIVYLAKCVFWENAWYQLMKTAQRMHTVWVDLSAVMVSLIVLCFLFCFKINFKKILI